MFVRGYALAAVALVGCGRIGFDSVAVSGDAAVDAVDAVDAAPLGPWGPATPVVIPGLVVPVDDPSLTGDRLMLVANFNFDDIAIATRASTTDAWSPLGIDAVLSTGAETEPRLAPDGLTIYFGSARAGTSGGFDLYVSTRANRAAAWSTPVRVPELSTPVDDTGGAITEDGLAIAITVGVSPRQLSMSTRATTGSVWNPPVPLTEVNSPEDDAGAHLTADGLALYFYSTRDGNDDLFWAERPSRTEPFGPPQPITELNTSSEETDPWVSPDRRHIVFASDRDGQSAYYEATR